MQPLDQRITASFSSINGFSLNLEKLNKKKLMEWVLSQFDSFTTHRDLRRIVPNAKHNIISCSQVWREMKPQTILNNKSMSEILFADLSVGFLMDDECEKSIME